MPVTLENWKVRKPLRNRLWPTAEAFLGDLALFVMLCAGAVSLRIVGTLPGNELVLLLLLPPLLATRGKRAFRRDFLWFYILAAGWLLSTVAADMYLGMPMANRMKGVARIAFFVFDFMAAAILVNGTRRVAVFCLGYSAINLSTAFPFRDAPLTAWKFGLGQALATLALLAVSYFYARRRFGVYAMVSVCLAALNLLLAVRSVVAILAVALAVTLPVFSGTAGARDPAGAVRGGRLLRTAALLALAAGAAYLCNKAVVYAARDGFFDESVTEKFESQERGKLGVLVGGRPETLVAIQAIIDSPIIGHGSFATDPKYIQMKQDIQYKYDYVDTDVAGEDDAGAIPTHSHLTLAWVESGLLGGVFWIYILVLAVRALLALGDLRPALTPLFAYLIANFCWALLYSPMGSIERIWDSTVVLMCFDILRAAQRSRLTPAGMGKARATPAPARLPLPVPGRLRLARPPLATRGT